MRKSKRMRKSNPIWLILLILFVIGALFPIYWMLVTSLKSFTETYTIDPTFWPKKVRWENYVEIFTRFTFGHAIRNSFIVSCLVAFGTVFLSVLSSYTVVRLPVIGKKTIPKIFLITYLIPSTILFIPIYIFLSQIGLANKFTGLILIYPTMTIPYATWVMITFFKSLSVEMEEAAMVDGATKLQVLTRVVLPVSYPTIVSVLIFSFTICWSEYIYALVIINDKFQRTITIALSSIIVADIIPWGPLMAGAFISTIPVIIFYTVASKHIISGLTMGAVKG